LLTGLAFLRIQLHRAREPALIFPQHIEVRCGIAHALGRFKRRLRALATPGEPAVVKFSQGFERGLLIFPIPDAERRLDLQCHDWLQDVRK
jgi:hypothetical protein